MRRYSIVIALGGLPLAVGAQQDALVVSVSQSVAHDTNLLRLPSGADPAALTGVRERGDTVSRTVAGVAFDREFSRQRVRASVSVDANRYANHKQFDFNGHQAAGTWEWALGPRWHGDATLRSERFLASFVDVRTDQKNLVDRDFARLGAGYRIAPGWSLVAATEAVRIRNSAAAFSAADLRETSVEAGARFTPGPSADWSLLWRHGDGHLGSGRAVDPSAGPPAAAGGRNYVDDRLLMLVSVEPNAISRVSGNLGYTQRRYDGADRQDFRGVTYALDYTWRRGDVFSMVTYLRRDVGVGSAAAATATATGAGSGPLGPVASQILAASYAETRSVGVRPAWQLTGKLRLQGQLDYTERRFDASASSPFTQGARRNDRLSTVGASLDYEVLRKVLLSAYVRQERRSSTQAQFGFDARVVGATLEVRF